MKYHIRLLVMLCTLSACSLLTPSHHRTEDYTPVFAAASGGDLATVKKAVENDPDLLTSTEWDKATLLHDAVGQNHLDVAAYLLDKGADVNAVTADGLTPLHMAAQNGNMAMITLLLEHDANINPRDAKGWTPLDRAQKWGHAAAAAFLRRQGGR